MKLKGFVKVVADAKYHEILGVHIIGPAAAELINEASTIMENELTVDELLRSIHGHPTFSENMYEAFADVLGKLSITHQKRKNKADKILGQKFAKIFFFLSHFHL